MNKQKFVFKRATSFANIHGLIPLRKTIVCQWNFTCRAVMISLESMKSAHITFKDENSGNNI